MEIEQIARRHHVPLLLSLRRRVAVIRIRFPRMPVLEQANKQAKQLKQAKETFVMLQVGILVATCLIQLSVKGFFRRYRLFRIYSFEGNRRKEKKTDENNC